MEESKLPLFLVISENIQCTPGSLFVTLLAKKRVLGMRLMSALSTLCFALLVYDVCVLCVYSVNVELIHQIIYL